jgi:hypothetical protein
MRPKILSALQERENLTETDGLPVEWLWPAWGDWYVFDDADGTVLSGVRLLRFWWALTQCGYGTPVASAVRPDVALLRPSDAGIAAGLTNAAFSAAGPIISSGGYYANQCHEHNEQNSAQGGYPQLPS